MKVILIGNGCSATEAELGESIDSNFDLVLRMNRFKTVGYEKFVGSKTDIWVVSDNAYQWVKSKTDGIEGSQNWKSYQAIYVGIPSFKFNEQNHLIEDVNNLDFPTYIFPKEVADLASNNLNLPSHLWPTLGVQCLYALLNDDEIEEVYIYGFDGKNKKYKYLHYFDNEPTWETNSYYGRKINHADEIEFKHINELVDSKKIKFLTKE